MCTNQRLIVVRERKTNYYYPEIYTDYRFDGLVSSFFPIPMLLITIIARNVFFFTIELQEEVHQICKIVKPSFLFQQLSEGARIREQLQSSLSTLNKTRDKYDKAFGASERALDL